jgi:hypothetical protein
MKVVFDFIALMSLGILAYGFYLIHPAALYLYLGFLFLAIGARRGRR